MKFGKLLKVAGDGLPECDGLFLRYKELKKQLKGMKKGTAEHEREERADDVAAATSQQLDTPPQQQGPETSGGSQLSPDELEFVRTLNEDLSRFNRFFMEKEEDSVIQLQALSDRLANIGMEAEGDGGKALKAALVDFHGELVLLLHWSLLNYAAVVKILKKHDKRTGLLLRAPYLANVLQQPFYSTNVMSRLVKRAEEHIQQLASMQQQEAAAAAAADATSSQSEQLPVDTQVFRRTAMALETWNTLVTNASTPSTVLPEGSAELVRQLRMRKQWEALAGASRAGSDQQLKRKGILQIDDSERDASSKRARSTMSSDEDEGSVDS